MLKNLLLRLLADCHLLQVIYRCVGGRQQAVRELLLLAVRLQPAGAERGLQIDIALLQQLRLYEGRAI